jgi:hypothetical protein
MNFKALLPALAFTEKNIVQAKPERRNLKFD